MNIYLKSKVEEIDLKVLGFEKKNTFLCKQIKVNKNGLAKYIIRVDLNKKPSKVVVAKLTRNGYQTIRTKRRLIKDLIELNYVMKGN